MELLFKYLKSLISKLNYFLRLLLPLLLACLINARVFAEVSTVLENTQNSLVSGTLLKQQNPINFLVRALKRDYEFIFFYSTTCLHCRDFTPILKAYSDNSGISVKAFVIGHEMSLYFSNSTLVSQKMVDQFFGKGAKISVPTLFILNKGNLHAYPVSNGALTYLELASRMNELTPKILQHEKNGRNRA